jgi:hypothetical protein
VPAADAAPGKSPAVTQVEERDGAEQIGQPNWLVFADNDASGAGLRAALEPLLDWPAYHRFRCLGVAIGSVDDAIRNMGNNTVVLRRSSDGRFVFLPYSLDLSAFGDTSLFGNTELELKCVADPDCASEARDACLTVADELQALAPEHLVDDAMAALRERGMVRSGDDERAVELRNYYAARAAAASVA